MRTLLTLAALCLMIGCSRQNAKIRVISPPTEFVWEMNVLKPDVALEARVGIDGRLIVNAYVNTTYDEKARNFSNSPLFIGDSGKVTQATTTEWNAAKRLDEIRGEGGVFTFKDSKVKLVATENLSVEINGRPKMLVSSGASEEDPAGENRLYVSAANCFRKGDSAVLIAPIAVGGRSVLVVTFGGAQ